MKVKLDFVDWVKKNYQPKILLDPPKDWNPKKDIYITFDGGKTQYGPIYLKDIPKNLQ